tara:strand:+ start:26 stop:208 length:183 start_codon:yes stop_codon:yes gene_type:complete
MKYSFQVDFEDVKTGLEFEKNGNLWVKQSTRTARIIKPVEYSSRWFYFGKREKINIEEVA